MTELTQNQKQMVADLLQRTDTKSDIENNIKKILCNAYGNEHTAKVYKELAELRINRFINT